MLRPWARSLLSPLPVLLHPWGLLGVVLRSPSRLLDGLTTAHHRYLDRMTATVTQSPVLFPQGFFCDGWGDLNTPKRVQELLQSNRMREVAPLAESDVYWTPPRRLVNAGVSLSEGTFKTTLANAKEFLPNSSLDAYYELVTPTQWEQSPPKERTLVGTCCLWHALKAVEA